MNKDRAIEQLQITKKSYELRIAEIGENAQPLFEKDKEQYRLKIQAIDYAIYDMQNIEELEDKIKYLEKANEWVDVKDRLPSESGWYLVTEYAPSEFITNIREFNLKHFITDYAQVVAWKPLPEPYVRSEENE